MIEKVKLPKEICDALDKVKTYKTHFAILEITQYKNWSTTELKILNTQNVSDIMDALVLGYEPQMTDEEMTKEFLKIYPSDTYKKGVRDALMIHGIKYDWLDGDV